MDFENVGLKTSTVPFLQESPNTIGITIPVIITIIITRSPIPYHHNQNYHNPTNVTTIPPIPLPPPPHICKNPGSVLALLQGNLEKIMNLRIFFFKMRSFFAIRNIVRLAFCHFLKILYVKESFFSPPMNKN